MNDRVLLTSGGLDGVDPGDLPSRLLFPSVPEKQIELKADYIPVLITAFASLFAAVIIARSRR